jgi:hypothetical protein
VAKPQTRQQLIDYCLRTLGHPVIEINVDEDQLEDRVDDALQFFAEYHFDGVEKVYLKYQIQQKDIDNGYISITAESKDQAGITGSNTFTAGTGSNGQNESSLAINETGQSGNVKIEDLIASVLQVFHFSSGTINMFDVRYQYALNDLYTFGTIELIHYSITQQYLSLIRQMLSPDKAIRFSRRNNKLYLDMKWPRDVKVGDYVVIEAYRVMDPRVYPEIYNDMLLKRYLTALIKRQWGANLSKFSGIQMLGGVTFNGTQIFNDALREIADIETTVQNKWELPPDFIVG